MLERVHQLIACARSRPLRAGLLVAGIALLVVLAVSRGFGGEDEGVVHRVVLGTFVQEVSLSGKVVAADDVDLGFSQGGRVSRVYADVGDAVSGGTVLAEVENGDLRATVLQRQAALEREQAALVSLKDGTRPEELAVARSEVRRDEESLAQAHSGVVESVQDAYTTADDAVRNVLDQFIDSPRTDPQVAIIVGDGALENRIENARKTIEGTLIGWQADAFALSASGDISSAVSRSQTNLSAVSALLADASHALNKALPSGSITQSDIDGYKTDVNAARSSVNAALSSLTSAVTSQKSASSALDTSRKNLALKEAGATPGDIAKQEAQVRAAEADVASARAQLAKSMIIAPFAGVVAAIDAEVGESVSAGTSVVSLIGVGKFQVESFVPEINIALIALDNPAAITLDAYGEDAKFAARVVFIDPAETVKDGVSTYRTILEFDAQDERIRAGMTANVLITTQERPGTLMIPVGLVVTEGNSRFAYVQEGEVRVRREVSVGAVSSLGDIEILSGLSEGEIVTSAPESE